MSVQVFTEAKFYGFEACIGFYSILEKNSLHSGAPIWKNWQLQKSKSQDWGFFVYSWRPVRKFTGTYKKETLFFKWLKQVSYKSVNICSVSNGAFVSGEAGL